MPEETLRYRIEIDEASLQSELARTRGAITNVLQTAVATGQYAVNQLNADIALTRQAIAAAPAPIISSPTADLGFFGASLAVAGVGAPPNMLTRDFRAMGERELQGRFQQMAFAVSREAVPVAAGLGAVGLGMAARAGPLATLALGGAAFLGGRAAADLGIGAMETRSAAEDILQASGAPHPMMRFTQPQREELARGLVQDIAADVRFGIEELPQMLAGGQAMNLFQGTRTVEEFRTRFRTMLDQVKTITRVFQQTTEEAMATLGEFNRLGITSPEVMNARLADVLSLTRATGMPAGQALQLGMAGAEAAMGGGIAPGRGFDIMMRNALTAQMAGATRAIDPNLFAQMGGVQGVAAQTTQFGFQAAQAPALRAMLAGLANESMTGLDESRVRQFVSGQLGVEDIQQQAFNRMADPAMRIRFASNQDLLQGQLATSGLAGPALFRMAEIRGQMIGAPPEDVFRLMGQQMGLDPRQRDLMLTMTRNAGVFEHIAARQREAADLELQLERQREEARFTARVGAGIEQFRARAGEIIGEPIRTAGRAVGGLFQNLVSLPSRALEWLDVQAGQAIFGERPMPEGLSQRQMIRSQAKEAEEALQASTRAVTWRVDFGTLKMFDRLSHEEFQQFEEGVVAQFSGDILDLIKEPDATRRGEAREKLREKMTGWFKTNFGHMTEDDAKEAKAFADKMLEVEKTAERNDNVRRGLEDTTKNVSALQLRYYAGEELPVLLAQGAREAGDMDRLTGIATQVAAGIRAGPEAGFKALQTLTGKAMPLLRERAPIRERLEVAEIAMRRGFLTPGDMALDTKELGSIAEQNLTAGQARFVSALKKAAEDSEGQEITADTIFKSIGMGLGQQFPSRTPSPQAQIDPMKWDQTTVILDRLTGAVNNLNTSAKELLRNTADQNKKTAGKA